MLSLGGIIADLDRGEIRGPRPGLHEVDPDALAPAEEKELTMTPNVGTADRIVRIIAGLAIIATGVYFESWWGAVGLAPLVTGLVRWCPAYCPLKLTTVRE